MLAQGRFKELEKGKAVETWATQRNNSRNCKHGGRKYLREEENTGSTRLTNVIPNPNGAEDDCPSKIFLRMSKKVS